jgi:hypothetical protein
MVKYKHVSKRTQNKDGQFATNRFDTPISMIEKNTTLIWVFVVI